MKSNKTENKQIHNTSILRNLSITYIWSKRTLNSSIIGPRETEKRKETYMFSNQSHYFERKDCTSKHFSARLKNVVNPL